MSLIVAAVTSSVEALAAASAVVSSVVTSAVTVTALSVAAGETLFLTAALLMDLHGNLVTVYLLLLHRLQNEVCLILRHFNSGELVIDVL